MSPLEARKATPTSAELVSTFQILELVAKALSQIHDGVEKSEVRRTLSAVQERFEKCEEVLERLPGGGLTQSNQMAEIKRLGEELAKKRALVQRYAQQDVVRRVLAERALPKQEYGKEEEEEEEEGADAEADAKAEDVLMELDM